MTQTISGPVVSSDMGGLTDGGNCFKVKTAGIDTNLRYLRSGTNYDVNVQNGTGTSSWGYTNHTTWNNPGGTCMSWPSSNTIKVGTVTMQANTTGQIATAKDLLLNTISPDADGSYQFTLPAAMNPTNGGVHEQAVCISSANSVNGNQAPLDILNVV